MTSFLNPQEVLKKLNLKSSMTAADFGCGSGGWVLPLAQILEDGKVYGLDILEEPLSALRSKAKTQRSSNVVSLKADVEKGTTLLSNSCDLVLMTNLLFQVDDKKAVLAEGQRVLKKGAKLLLVDWKREISPDTIKKIAQSVNLKLVKEFSAGLYHWGIIFQK